MIYWISFAVAGVALLVMLVTLFRHWREIRLIDPDSIQEERERRKRDELILHRLERIKADKFGPLSLGFRRLAVLGKVVFHGAYIRLIRLEKFYSQAKAPFAFIAPSAKERLKLILDEARSLARDQKFAEAEKRYLEILALDARHWDAYKGLGLIYIKQKLWQQAKETFEFLAKSKKADDTVYASLAEIAENTGDASKAEELRLKAVEFRPRLANRQAEMASFYLDRDEPQKAWPFAKQASELDQKSARYLEISLDTAILLGDRLEAQKRYDKLRLLSEDRPKLQAYREKIDALG
jgi:tetratricopeptide (TPR) repeat protein